MATAAFLILPPSSWLMRWRRTLPYAGLIVIIALILHVVWPLAWPWAILAAPPALFVVMTCSMAFVISHRADDMWHVVDGRDGALILVQRQRRQQRRVLHSWATWRHGRGLGRLVAEAALREAPRPLWLEPATPELEQLYRGHGALPDPGGTRWMVLQ